ncbi:MAG: tetratricopeptide repeat protein [Pyrinomonadaceae bacterium]
MTVKKSDELSTVSSHSQTKSDEQTPNVSATVVPKSDTKTKWTQSGNPIDTSGFDSEIKQLQDKMKANPKVEDLKKTLVDAYIQRGMALTEARQYASALGDYRKAQKLDPENEEAKKWIGQIISIYESINREYPKEGEEPPPLPFKQEN